MTIAKQKKFANVVEQANMVEKLYGQGHDQQAISVAMGVTVPQISNLKTIAELPLFMKKRIIKGQIAATLLLRIIRENKDLPRDKVVEMVEDAYLATNGEKMTLKDLNKHIKRHPSIAIFRKILKQYNITSVKENKEMFEIMRGMILGKFDRPAMLKLFGLNK